MLIEIKYEPENWNCFKCGKEITTASTNILKKYTKDGITCKAICEPCIPSVPLKKGMYINKFLITSQTDKCEEVIKNTLVNYNLEKDKLLEEYSSILNLKFDDPLILEKYKKLKGEPWNLRYKYEKILKQDAAIVIDARYKDYEIFQTLFKIKIDGWNSKEKNTFDNIEYKVLKLQDKHLLWQSRKFFKPSDKFHKHFNKKIEEFLDDAKLDWSTYPDWMWIEVWTSFTKKDFDFDSYWEDKLTLSCGCCDVEHAQEYYDLMNMFVQIKKAKNGEEYEF